MKDETKPRRKKNSHMKNRERIIYAAGKAKENVLTHI
jgi:hypothetical protein